MVIPGHHLYFRHTDRHVSIVINNKHSIQIFFLTKKGLKHFVNKNMFNIIWYVNSYLETS
jgi:hypothetical protein